MTFEAQERLQLQELSVKGERDWGLMVLLGSPQGPLKHRGMWKWTQREEVIRGNFFGPAVCLLVHGATSHNSADELQQKFWKPRENTKFHLIKTETSVFSVSTCHLNLQTQILQ